MKKSKRWLYLKVFVRYSQIKTDFKNNENEEFGKQRGLFLAFI